MEAGEGFLRLPSKSLCYCHISESAHPEYGILYCNGLKSTIVGAKSTFLKDIAIRHGMAFTAFDYQGHGKSSGDYLSCGVGDWAQDAADMIAHVAHQARKLVLVGEKGRSGEPQQVPSRNRDCRCEA